MNELVKKFKDQARQLAGSWCMCGQYEPVSITPGWGVVYVEYGFPGSQPVRSEQKHCRHRRIEKALIKAYRAGRAA